MAGEPAVRDGGDGGAAIPHEGDAAREKGLFHAVARHRQFRFLLAAGAITQLGQWFQNVALGWLALTLTNSPAFVGQIGFAGGIPILLISLPAGALLDRLDRRRALLACQIVGALVALAVALVSARGTIAPWHLVAAAVVSGALLAIVQPATQTLVPALVPREDLPNALALSSAGGSSSRIIGPSLAGALIGAAGPAGPFVAQAGMLLAAAGLTARVRPPAGARPGAALGGGVLDGLRVIRRDPTLTGLLLVASAPALLAYPYIQLLPVFARDVLGLGPRGLGLVMGASGVGALTGALVVAKFGDRAHKGRMALGLGIAYGFVLTAFAQSPWPVTSALAAACTTLVGSAFYSYNQILLQLHAREELRGRVIGALALTFGLQPVGSLLIGDLAGRIGAPWAVTLGALGSSLCLALIGARYRALWRL